jgi:hypothetical protein
MKELAAFANSLPNRTLAKIEGPNAGSLSIISLNDPDQVAIAQTKLPPDTPPLSHSLIPPSSLFQTPWKPDLAFASKSPFPPFSPVRISFDQPLIQCYYYCVNSAKEALRLMLCYEQQTKHKSWFTIH